jgi:hypothetical protein
MIKRFSASPKAGGASYRQSLVGVDQDVRLVRLQRLKPRFEDIEGIVRNKETALQFGVALLAPFPGRGVRTLEGV